MKKVYYLFIFLCLNFQVLAQNKSDAFIVGKVQCQKCPEKQVPFASISIKGTTIGTAADEQGQFKINNLPQGEHVLIASAVGYRSQEKSFNIRENETVEVQFVLEQDNINLDHIVISGTRYELDRKESPVMVNVIDDHIFEATQSVSLSEGLNFQPGLRMETNCQNCGFTQLRMNGLDGPYTQILVNSRPIFSSLQGVYGLDLIPANMIERIEVVRGGGSALYGGNAIAGTVNIITKDPVNNSYQVKSQLSVIDNEVPDQSLSANLSLVNDDLKTGINLYGMFRNRDYYDANGDGYSEITVAENNTLGGKAYFKPSQFSKLSLDFHGINDFRRGGNLFDLPPHQADVAEQVRHQIYGGGLAYELYNKSMTNKLSVYSSVQSTRRESYYGAGGNLTDFDPDQHFVDENGNNIPIAEYLEDEWGRVPTSEEIDLFSANLKLELAEQAANYYGHTDDIAWVSGLQLSKSLNNSNFTGGIEYRINEVKDRMPGYNRLIDQKVINFGGYLQYEYKPSSNFTALGGLRYDYNKIDGQYDLYGESLSTKTNLHALNPRLNILYKPHDMLQIRGSYAKGFRTPQAFDEDLHIETVGGGAQFVRMSENLKPETSDAFTFSLEYTPSSKKQFYVLLEGFYTTLYDPFVNVGILSGDSGSPDILEKQNASENGIVSGVNLESRLATSRKFNLMVGGTWQKAVYDQPIEIYSNEETDGKSIYEERMLRTPDLYGYFVSSYRLFKPFRINLSGNYTGSMAQPYESGLQRPVGIYHTPDFMEINLKLCYDILKTADFKVELEAGMQNIFNSYQKDFDTGIDRDVAYMYGPARPRTIFFAVKLGNL